ncbi:hypothetical protein [Dysgonomonas termitidis]|uniref:Uncharacterized protein n=1 Tax=Dysgonomonas termitidis TaxID=1516126 RepID=A0ABV9KTJ3_9BACT
MKTHEVQLFFAMCIFAGICVALGWCSQEAGLLVVIIQLLVLIVTLLSRIYTAIINHYANLRSDKKELNERDKS